MTTTAVHLIRVCVPGLPPRRALVTRSLLARLSRDAAAIGKAAEITAARPAGR